MPRRSARDTAIQGVRVARPHVSRSFRDLPNVSGSMIGLRVKGNEVTDEVCLTVIVSEKKELSELPRKHRIPGFIRHARRSIPIDVLQVRRMHPQDGIFPSPGPLGVRIGRELGTVSAYCQSSHGFAAMTCAHVVGGSGAPMSVPVEGWSETQANWFLIGRTADSISSPGSSTSGDFGFTDVGLILLQHPELLERAQAANTMRALPGSLGQAVVGDGAAQKVREGQILGVETVVFNFASDVVVRVANPGTVPGDSGMLWKDMEGNAVAIHAIGEQLAPGVGSPITASMWAGRAVVKLQAAIGIPLRLLSLPS
jgi:hypothetical protein